MLGLVVGYIGCYALLHSTARPYLEAAPYAWIWVPWVALNVLDVHSTLGFVRLLGTEFEGNAVARWLMGRVGPLGGTLPLKVPTVPASIWLFSSDPVILAAWNLVLLRIVWGNYTLPYRVGVRE